MTEPLCCIKQNNIIFNISLKDTNIVEIKAVDTVKLYRWSCLLIDKQVEQTATIKELTSNINIDFTPSAIFKILSDYSENKLDDDVTVEFITSYQNTTTFCDNFNDTFDPIIIKIKCSFIPSYYENITTNYTHIHDIVLEPVNISLQERYNNKINALEKRIDDLTKQLTSYAVIVDDKITQISKNNLMEIKLIEQLYNNVQNDIQSIQSISGSINKQKKEIKNQMKNIQATIDNNSLQTVHKNSTSESHIYKEMINYVNQTNEKLLEDVIKVVHKITTENYEQMKSQFRNEIVEYRKPAVDKIVHHTTEDS